MLVHVHVLCVHCKFERLVFIANPKPKGIPYSARSGISNPENPDLYIQKTESVRYLGEGIPLRIHIQFYLSCVFMYVAMISAGLCYE